MTTSNRERETRLKASSLLNEYDLADRIASPPQGDCPYALFLGAGASVGAGIPTAETMVNQWKRQLYEHSKRLEQSKDITDEVIDQFYSEWQALWHEREVHTHEGDYSLLFSHFRGKPPERQIYIENLVNEARLSFGYLYLAALINYQRFNRIITVNFDDLVNDALFKFYNHRAVVVAFDSAAESVRMDSLRPKIIKLHGDFLYSNVRNVGQEIVRLDKNMEDKLLITCKERGLIVVGYGGYDESIMAPIGNMVRSLDHLNMGLHWCLYNPPNTAEVSVPESLERLRRTYPDRVTLYATPGFDWLMECIFNRCFDSAGRWNKLPLGLTQPREATQYRELRDALRDTAQDPYLTPQMREYVRKFQRESIEFKTSAAVLVDEADNCFDEGNQLIKKSELQAARASFETGLALIGQVEHDADAPTKVRSRARKRETGLYVGLAEVDSRESRPSLENCLKTLQAVERGMQETANLSLQEMSAAERHAFPYNAICALAIIHSLNGGMEDAQVALGRRYYVSLKEYDPDGRQRHALGSEYCVDAGFLSLLMGPEGPDGTPAS